MQLSECEVRSVTENLSAREQHKPIALNNIIKLANSLMTTSDTGVLHFYGTSAS